MKVKLSSEARQDINRQVDYLRGKTNSGILTFRNIISRGSLLLDSQQPHAGRSALGIPIRGARRVTVDGWHFDYDIIGSEVWIGTERATPTFTHLNNAFCTIGLVGRQCRLS